MRLFLLLHAEAYPENTNTKRELSSKGIASIKRLVDNLNCKDLAEIAEIRHSPWVGARQTAESFRSAAGLNAKLKEVPLLEPFDDFRILADFVNKLKSDVLLVGNQPNLSMLASFLLTRDVQSDLFVAKKTGLLCLEKSDSQPKDRLDTGAWKLSWLIQPRLFKKK